MLYVLWEVVATVLVDSMKPENDWNIFVVGKHGIRAIAGIDYVAFSESLET